MKRIIYLITVILVSQIHLTHAQIPQAINYQTVVRDANGNVVANQSVKLGFLIHDGSATGTVVYAEIDSGQTNKFGLFTTAIGRGVIQGGEFFFYRLGYRPQISGG